MLPRRFATFLLGIWLGCCLLVDFISMQTGRISERFLSSPGDEAHRLMGKADPASTAALLNYISHEETRSLAGQWEVAQLVLAISIGILTVFSDQKRPIPILMCVAMFMLAAGQAFVITPRLIDSGQQLDLGGGGAVAALTNQFSMLAGMHAAFEGIKLLLGGALASYYFMMESTIKRSRRSSGRTRSEEIAEGSARLS